jgi:hypothetical protein
MLKHAKSYGKMRDALSNLMIVDDKIAHAQRITFHGIIISPPREMELPPRCYYRRYGVEK